MKFFIFCYMYMYFTKIIMVRRLALTFYLTGFDCMPVERQHHDETEPRLAIYTWFCHKTIKIKLQF